MISAVGTLYTLSLLFQQAITQKPVDWKAIDQVLGDQAICKEKPTASAFPAMIFMSQSARSRYVRVSR